MSTAQTFKLTSPTGEVIMTGSLDALMERLPDTHARNDALDSMLKIACDAVEAEERLEDAWACAAQILTDGITRLCARMDREEQRREEQQRQDAEEAERAAQEKIQRTLDALPDPDQPYAFDLKEREATGDDGELEIQHAPSEGQYGNDAEPVKPVLSYSPVPMPYIKGKRDAEGDLPEVVESRSPAPLGSYPVYYPAELGCPEDPKQVSPPIDASLNEE
jgi:hypothetical protein